MSFLQRCDPEHCIFVCKLLITKPPWASLTAAYFHLTCLWLVGQTVQTPAASFTGGYTQTIFFFFLLLKFVITLAWELANSAYCQWDFLWSDIIALMIRAFMYLCAPLYSRHRREWVRAKLCTRWWVFKERRREALRKVVDWPCPQRKRKLMKVWVFPHSPLWPTQFLSFFRFLRVITHNSPYSG